MSANRERFVAIGRNLLAIATVTAVLSAGFLILGMLLHHKNPVSLYFTLGAIASLPLWLGFIIDIVAKAFEHDAEAG
jgi:hypothetical protein